MMLPLHTQGCNLGRICFATMLLRRGMAARGSMLTRVEGQRRSLFRAWVPISSRRLHSRSVLVLDHSIRVAFTVILYLHATMASIGMTPRGLIRLWSQGADQSFGLFASMQNACHNYLSPLLSSLGKRRRKHVLQSAQAALETAQNPSKNTAESTPQEFDASPSR